MKPPKKWRLREERKVVLPKDRDKWNEPQPFEPRERYDAYVVYRDMGMARTTGALSDKPGMPKPSVLDQWAYRWRWQERAQQWDEEQILGTISEDEIAQARLSLKVMGKRLREKCLEALQEIKPGAIRPSTLPALAKAAMELTLAGSDLPTSVTETRVGGQVGALLEDLRGMSDEQLVGFRDLIQSQRAGTPAAPSGSGDPGPTDGRPH